MRWLWSWMKQWGNPIGAKAVSTPSTTIPIKGKPISTESTPQEIFIPKIDLSKKRITLKRPFPKDVVISSPFGEREINGAKEFHFGYDFKVPVGTKIYACADGAAFRVGLQDEFSDKVGFGLRIWQEIKVGGKRFFIFYGHLSKVLINEGDRIRVGQEIAFSGNTGRTTGPHTHIECRLKDSSDRFEIDFV